MHKTFFKKNGKTKKEPLDMDITSLLDILVILLVFLLKSYNASDLKLDLVSNLTVPDSKVRDLGHHAIIIQLDKNKNVYFNQKKIGNLENNITDQINSTIKKIKDEFKLSSPEEITTVNLVFDKSIQYDSMQSIMHLCASNGLTEFKLIVQGDY